jgi:hypothetical protein
MANLLFPLSLKRQYSGSLDPDLTFSTTVELNAYLSSPLRYAGQIVTCQEQESSLFVISNDTNSWIDVTDPSNSISTYVDPISAGLQSQIDSIDLTPYTLLTDTQNISAGLDTRLDSLESFQSNLDATYATDTMVASISGYLQSNIDLKTNQSYALEIDEDQVLSLIHNCPVTTFVDNISGMNIVYTDFRTITNHTKTITKDIDELPILSIENFTYNGYNYTVTKNLIFISGGFSSSTITISGY